MDDIVIPGIARLGSVATIVWPFAFVVRYRTMLHQASARGHAFKQVEEHYVWYTRGDRVPVFVAVRSRIRVAITQRL